MKVLCRVAAGLAIAVAASIAAGIPAGADSYDDQRFFRALDGMGFVLMDPPLLITQGRMICNEGLAHGVSWGEMHGQLLQWGYSHDSASILAIAAINTYCPQYRAVSAQISQNR